jgi:hypothetical protein
MRRSLNIEGEMVGTNHYKSTLYRRKSEEIHRSIENYSGTLRVNGLCIVIKI